jgi:cytochrome c peroxidase
MGGGGAGGAGGAGGVMLTLQEMTVAKTQSPLPPLPPNTSNKYADNPAAAKLGQRFFFDKSIAGPIVYGPNDLGKVGETGKVSCASCHVAPWGTDTRSFPNELSLGVTWTTRNTPPIANVGFYEWFYWDGRSDSLWQQALLAGENALQQGSDRLRITHVIYTKYKADYEAIFGALDSRFDPNDPAAFPPVGKPKAGGAPDGVWEAIPAADQTIITQAFVNWGKSIEAYERLIVSRNAPWDKFVAGDNNAISQDAIKGYKLFVGPGYCINCHSGPLFSDSKPHNIGVPSKGGIVDHGRYDTLLKALTNKFRADGPWSDDQAGGTAKYAAASATPEQFDWATPQAGPVPMEDLGKFRTKHLRQITQTGPWMHNGSFSTLEEVLALYNAGGGDGGDGMLDKAFMGHVPLKAEELPLLLEFMKTLTGDPVDPALLMDTSAP